MYPSRSSVHCTAAKPKIIHRIFVLLPLKVHTLGQGVFYCFFLLALLRRNCFVLAPPDAVPRCTFQEQ
jgi:hypothetical protein